MASRVDQRPEFLAFMSEVKVVTAEHAGGARRRLFPATGLALHQEREYLGVPLGGGGADRLQGCDVRREVVPSPEVHPRLGPECQRERRFVAAFPGEHEGTIGAPLRATTTVGGPASCAMRACCR
jgi:hypothetical protein